MRMKSIRLFIRIFICTLTLLSCNKKEPKDNKLKTIIFRDQYVDLIDKFDFKFIPLETKEEALISLINYIQLVDDKLFILDAYKKEEVLVFDTSGHYLSKISNKGEGPKEYVSLSGMHINQKNKSLILSDYKNKLLFYDLDSCKLQKTLHSSLCGNDFIQLNENRFVFTSIKGFEQLGKNKKQYVLITDSTEKMINYGYPLPFYANYSSTLSGSKFYSVNKDTFIYHNLFPEIYKIKSDRIEPAYRLSFESMKFPPIDFLRRASKDKRDYTSDLNQSDYIKAYSIFETNNVTMIYLMQHQPVFAFYDKATQESFTLPIKDYYKSLQLNALLFPLGATDEYIIFKVNLDDVDSPNEIKNPELRKVVEKRKEDDNCIIALGKWKRNS